MAEMVIQQSRLKEARKKESERERDFLTLPQASTGILGLFYPFLICILMKMHEGWGEAG